MAVLCCGFGLLQLGLAQVLQLVGGSLQLSIPSPFLELQHWAGLLTLDLFALVPHRAAPTGIRGRGGRGCR